MEQLVLLEFGPNGARATVTNTLSADRGLARERPGDESPILPAAAICSTAVQIEGPISPGRPICFCPTAKVHSCLRAAAARSRGRLPNVTCVGLVPPVRPDLCVFCFFFLISRCQSELGHPVLHGGRVRPVGGGAAPPR